MKSVMFLTVFLVFTIGGNIFLKRGADEIELAWKKEVLSHVVTSPNVILGVMSYGLAAVFWFISLSLTPLNIAISVSACAYVMVVLVAFLLFQEPIPPVRWIGIGMIASGLIIIGRSV